MACESSTRQASSAPWRPEQLSNESPEQTEKWSRLPPTPESVLLSPARSSLEHAPPPPLDPVCPIEPSMVRFEAEMPTPPQPRRMLSRSRTLRTLQSSASNNAQKMNYYAGFNHHNWFLSIRWIFKGSGTNVFLPLFIVMVFAVVVVTLVETLGLEARLDLDTDVTSGLGGCMALLLAFRLNVCFSRWWEGRMLWGRVIESARSLVTTRRSSTCTTGSAYASVFPEPVGAQTHLRQTHLRK